MTKRKCVIEIIFLLFIAALFAWGTALEKQQQRISDGMIRLHVVANSDTQEDQSIKLQVRDAVLLAAQPILQDSQSVEEAKALLAGNLDTLQSAANETLKKFGSSDIAEVSLNRELFGTRHYESFSLPGGYYDALRVTIGEGEGHNWWCVVYPQICMTASTEQQEAVAVMAGMDLEDAALIYGQTEEYELKFKTLEVFENILTWLRTLGDGIPTSR